MRQAIYIYIFLCLLVSATAQNTHLTGFAPNYKGREVTLYTYTDYISNMEIPVSTQVVNDSGVFRFTFETENIKRVVIRSGKQKANLYLEPNRNYTVFMPARDTVRFVNPNIEQNVDLTFAITDTTEINALVIGFNECFDKFWADNFQYFVMKRSRARLDSFELQMQARYAPLNKSYFNAFITYAVAGMDLNTFQSKNDLAKKYILGKPLLYDSYEYMSFFNSFFEHYLQTYALSKNGSALVEQINEKANYEGCMQVLAGDKFLKNDTIRELVLIKGLSELYYVPDFSRKNVLSLLSRIATDSKIVLHQGIAANVIRSFSKLQPGAVAPEFSLRDKTGKLVNLSDFKGKYVYLDFWATWCTPCLQEMKLIPNLKKKYGDKIIFVSISTDEDTALVKKFLAKNPKYDWIFLTYTTNRQVKDDYEIKSIPSYFLINTYGNFAQSPALRPAQSIEATFSDICNKKPPNKGR